MKENGDLSFESLYVIKQNLRETFDTKFGEMSWKVSKPFLNL